MTTEQPESSPEAVVSGPQIPKWWEKHPCLGCGTGYGRCSEGLRHNFMCCSGCNHPTRWSEDFPYTPDEIEEMWAGQEMPHHTKRIVKQLREKEANDSQG